MLNDLFGLLDIRPTKLTAPATSTTSAASATPPAVTNPMAGLTTTHHDDGTRTLAHDDGTRTLAHGATVVGHYVRVRARWGAPAHWRGVTPAGRMVSAVTEPGVRRALMEARL